MRTTRRNRVTVEALAKEAQIDLDETLVRLWDAGFERLTAGEDWLKKGDANRARRALGLPTRRELGSLAHWQEEFDLTTGEVISLLQSKGVGRPVTGARLSGKAIRRLTRELSSRITPAVPASEPPPLQKRSMKPLLWQNIGRSGVRRYLSAEEIKAVHYALVEDFRTTSDPLEPPGLRSVALLESAAGRPQTSLGSDLKYPTVEMAAAALLHSIVHNHPFHNGNKRTALVAMLVFLDENGVMLTCSEDDLFRQVLRLAAHGTVTEFQGGDRPDREVLEMAQWLVRRCRWIEKGDRALSWRRLAQILATYACRCSVPPTVGNRMNIQRDLTVQKATLFGRRSDIRELRTQVAYSGQGSEVDKSTVAKVRRDLELDEEHGVDSATFYDHATAPLSEFILQYRKILRRLARL